MPPAAAPHPAGATAPAPRLQLGNCVFVRLLRLLASASSSGASSSQPASGLLSSSAASRSVQSPSARGLDPNLVSQSKSGSRSETQICGCQVITPGPELLDTLITSPSTRSTRAHEYRTQILNRRATLFLFGFWGHSLSFCVFEFSPHRVARTMCRE